MDDHLHWLEGIPVSITVTDAAGKILSLNARARETFAKDGGGALVGRSVFDCHPGPARAKTEALWARREPNHYTIRKNGRKKVIHQLPWFDASGAFAGFVEISVPVPEEMPHFDRG